MIIEIKTGPSSSPSSRELIIVRDFNAARKLVSEAWTDPKHIILCTKTIRLTMTMQFRSLLKKITKEYGAIEGAEQTMARLDEYALQPEEV